MKRALLFILALSVVIAEQFYDCLRSDIKSIIGGPDYTVDDMRGIHFYFEGERDGVLAFGRLTKNGVSKAFAFIYDYNQCIASEVVEFSGANQGFKEAYV